MTTTVYIWRIGRGGKSRWSETAGQPLANRVSGSIGGFGHVALQVGNTYMSYWPPTDDGEKQSFSLSYREDKERCQRSADREITISRLDEGQEKALWKRYKQTSFKDVNNNCCTVSINVLAAGAVNNTFSNKMRATGLALLSPIKSVRVAFEHDFRQFIMGGVHDPSQVEEFADQLSYLF